MTTAARQRRRSRFSLVSGLPSSLSSAARSHCPQELSLPRLPLPALFAHPSRAPPPPLLLCSPSCPCFLRRSRLSCTRSLARSVCCTLLPHVSISRRGHFAQGFLFLRLSYLVPWIALSPGHSLLHAHPQPCGPLSPRSLRLVVATRGGSSTLPRYSIPASAGSSQQSSL